MTLKVHFDDPSCGWVELAIKSDDVEVRIVGSYSPEDSFLGLINALQAMLQTQGRQIVTWFEEPQEVELCFQRTVELITLTIERFSDHRRVEHSGKTVLESSGTFAEICLPFWRALRNLQGRRTVQEMRQGWHRDFPHAELDRLTAAIKETIVK